LCLEQCIEYQKHKGGKNYDSERNSKKTWRAPGSYAKISVGSQQIYLEALRRGYIEIFIEAGAVVSTPTCGPCLGGHMGILARGEKALATTNRNFVGRMGHPESEVYLASPAVAAASAIKGRIAAPWEA
jgi:3-isopropylmalate/(R)-2-methylmalate dehydratase large subunit